MRRVITIIDMIKSEEKIWYDTIKRRIDRYGRIGKNKNKIGTTRKTRRIDPVRIRSIEKNTDVNKIATTTTLKERGKERKLTGREIGTERVVQRIKRVVVVVVIV